MITNKVKFNRPKDFSYNADLKSLQDGIESLMDVVERQQEVIEKLVSGLTKAKPVTTAKASAKTKARTKAK